jgi:hypothetical protein
MNKFVMVAVMACAGAALLVAWISREPASAQERPAPVAQKWEYKVVQVPVTPFPEKEGLQEFTKLGGEGWELCSTVSSTDKRGVAWGTFFFKRPKR